MKTNPSVLICWEERTSSSDVIASNGASRLGLSFGCSQGSCVLVSGAVGLGL